MDRGFCSGCSCCMLVPEEALLDMVKVCYSCILDLLEKRVSRAVATCSEEGTCQAHICVCQQRLDAIQDLKVSVDVLFDLVKRFVSEFRTSPRAPKSHDDAASTGYMSMARGSLQSSNEDTASTGYVSMACVSLQNMALGASQKEDAKSASLPRRAGSMHREGSRKQLRAKGGSSSAARAAQAASPLPAPFPLPATSAPAKPPRARHHRHVCTWDAEDTARVATAAAAVAAVAKTPRCVRR